MTKFQIIQTRDFYLVLEIIKYINPKFEYRNNIE
jgi:hypothetical protein